MVDACGLQRLRSAGLRKWHTRALLSGEASACPAEHQENHKGTAESVLTTSMSKSVFLKRVSLLNPRVRTNFVAFSFRKNQEGASKFGSILGRHRGLVNSCSAAAGRAPNWTGRTVNSS